MEIIRNPNRSAWPDLLNRPIYLSGEVDARVIPILDAVKKRGDRAVFDFTEQLDGVKLSSLAVTQEEIDKAGDRLSPELKDAMSLAAGNIEYFHQKQQFQPEHIETAPGVICWQKPVAIQKVGLYIPGGSAPLFSTVLMLAVPARLAGCREIILCTPPGKEGQIHPAVLYAAKLTGVTAVYKAGGAQAIAAMAFGTETIPRVHKIFGPGNQYVTAAKQLVSRHGVAIDMPAGPSELAVVADDSAHPEFVASDLLSQAEHGPDSQVLLFTVSEKLAGSVMHEVENQLKDLPRRSIAIQSLQHSRIFILPNWQEIMDMVNHYAPEHLILASRNAKTLAELVIHAGSVFIGDYTPESAGDYLSGTNHTLPTNGYAQAYNGVNLDSFIRKITFQEISRQGLHGIGKAIMTLAEAEELTAHSRAVAMRISGQYD